MNVALYSLASVVALSLPIASAGFRSATVPVNSVNSVQKRSGNQITIVGLTRSASQQSGPPKAAFRETCDSTLACKFADESTSDDSRIVTWSWNFGDGSNGSTQNATHTYAKPGTYKVALKVTDEQNRSDSTSHDVTVAGTSKPNQSPDANFTEACTGLECQFTDGSTDPDGSVTAWAWNFGDGKTGASASPAHRYDSAGTYKVTLVVTDNGGAADTVSREVRVSRDAHSVGQVNRSRMRVSFIKGDMSLQSPRDFIRLRGTQAK